MNWTDLDALEKLTADVGHCKVVCRVCNITITQCRCIEPNKAIVYAICDACEKVAN